MENAITDLLDKIVPKLNTLLSDIRLWTGLLLYAGPVLLLGIGLFCFFLSPKEANYRLGYFSIYGMGSVPAWRYSQKLGGLVMGGLGLLLLIVSIIISLVTAGKPLNDVMTTIYTVLIIQGSAAVAAYIGVEVTLIVRYDLAGNLRKRWRRKRTDQADRPIKTEEKAG